MAEKQDDMQVLEAVLKDNLEQIEILEAERVDAELKADEATKKAEIADKKATKVKKELQEIAPLVDRVKAYAGEYGRSPEELLPEAGTLESGKGYREKKAIPFFRKMADKLFSLYLAYCKLQDQYKQLDREFNRVWNKKVRLQERNEVLEQRVEALEVIEQDYGRVRRALGNNVIDRLLNSVKEEERLKAEMEKEKRKVRNLKKSIER